MGRFHQSMSWDSSTDPSPTDSGQLGDSSHSGPDFDKIEESDENDYFFDAGGWSQVTGHRNFFLPIHYTPSYRYPLVVWLHSNGFNENQIDHVMPHISVRNYIGTGIRGNRAADSSGHRFDWHESPAGIASAQDAVIDAVEEAMERFSVNSSRVVLAGYQTGGTMALRIAMREPDRFAGAISLGGRMPQGSIRNLHQLRSRKLPMLWQWGQQNPQYNDQNFKTDCQASMAIGGQVEVRQYPGEDEMDTVVLRDVDEWIMRRIVSDSSIADSDRWATSPILYSSN